MFMKKISYLILSLILLVGCASSEKDPITNDPDPIVIEEPEKEISVSFVAVGDNLIHGAIYSDPLYVNAGYDFTSIYDEVKPTVEEADIAYVNQETILGGREMGLSHYPQFNSPQEIGDALVAAGFNWVNHATNHTLDRGEEALINTLNFWDKYPEIKVSGIARNESEASQIQIIEKDGVKFGILAYTYGTNGIAIPEGKEYLVNLIDKDKIKQDVKTLETKCDAILVSMHWGQEYSFVPSEEQEELAQFLADLGVDVIIGSHPHVIQPMSSIKGVNGNETLIIYSLGNFLSAQDQNFQMLGGLASWNLVYNTKTKEITYKDAKFLPTINFYGEGYRNYKVYLLKDYTNEIASRHGLSLLGQDVSREYFINQVHSVMDDSFPIEY